MDWKKLILPILVGVTFIFSIAACAAPQIRNGRNSVYLVKSSGPGYSVQNEEYNCNELRESANASAAFGIMSCLLLAALLIVTIVELFVSLPSLPVSRLIILVVLLVVIIVFTLLSWTVMLHVFHDGLCGGGSLESSGYHLAGGFGCMIVTNLLEVLVLIVVVVMGGGGASVVKAFEAPKSDGNAGHS